MIPEWSGVIFLIGEVGCLSSGDLDRLGDAGGSLLGSYLRGEGGLDSPDPTFSFQSILIIDDGRFPSQTGIYESAILVKEYHEMLGSNSLRQMMLAEWMRSVAPQLAAISSEKELQLRNLLSGDAVPDHSSKPSDAETLVATVLNVQGSNKALLEENSHLRVMKELSTKILTLISTVEIILLLPLVWVSRWGCVSGML